MLETVSASLIVAAMSGLTLMAYKYPTGYSKIAKFLIPAVLLGYAAIGLWDTAVTTTYYQLHSHLDPSKYEAARLAVKSLHFPLALTTIVAIGLISYLMFLLLLPTLLEQKADKHGEKKHNATGG